MTVETHHQCPSCFFTTKFPGIAIEENGNCNYCNTPPLREQKRSQTFSNLEELRKLADELRQRPKRKYDCIIGASGGLDSSYVIYIAKKELNLNPLIISYDHGFNYDTPRRNLKALCEKFDLDLKIVKSPGHYDLKYVRSTVQALKSLNVYWGICSFCHYILLAVAYRYAIDEGVSAIFTSSNLYEEELHIQNSFQWRYMLRSLMKSPVWKMPKTVFHLGMARYYLTRLKLEFYIPPVSNLWSYLPKSSPVPAINITEYVNWDVDHMIKTLEEETGWQQSEHPNLKMRFDCKIEDSFINHSYKQATGLTVHGIIANNLIQDGLRTRDELTSAVEHYDSVIGERTDELMDFMGLRKRKQTRTPQPERDENPRAVTWQPDSKTGQS